MRALVTGGAGFLGSSLVDRLLAAGLEVDALDDLTQGQMNNLREALKRDRFKFHLGSVLEGDEVRALVERADLVFHLAAIVGMPLVLEARGRTLRVNAHGSYNVLRACARFKKRVVLFSSSEVYGSGNGSPFSEGTPLNPGVRGTARWYYAVSKICSEAAAFHLHREQGLPVTVVRPFNAAGLRQTVSSGMVIPVFVRKALSGEPLPVHGTGAQRRTFVAVQDLIDQVIGIAMDSKSLGLAVNVGGVEETSILDLARLVIDVVGSSSPIRSIPYEIAYGEGYTDHQQRRPDLSLLDRMGHLRRLTPVQDVIVEMASALEKEQGEIIR